MKVRVLCLFGTDGSGKTSIAKKIQLYLNAKQIPVKITWMRGSHTLASVLARFLSRFEKFRGKCNPYYNVCIPSKMNRLWVWVEFLSVWPILIAKFLAPRLKGDIVIAERGLIDFLIWLIVMLKRPEVLSSIVGRIIISLAFHLCNVIVYIRADLNVLLNRRKGYPEEELIPIYLYVYDKLAKVLKVPIVDTSNEIITDSVNRVLVHL